MMGADDDDLLESEADDNETDKAQADDAQIEAADDEGPDDDDLPTALTLDDSELDTEIVVGDEAVSLRTVIEAYSNRDSAEVLNSERQELETMREQLDKQKAEFDYVNDESVPHVFLTKALTRMVEAGTLPKEGYELVKEGFSNLIAAGLYNPDAAVKQSQILKEQSEAQAQKQALADEQRQIQADREMLQVEREFGDLTPEIAQKLVDFIKSDYRKTGKVMTLPQAAAANRTLFVKPAPSKRKLANRLRSSAQEPARQRKLSAADALETLYNS